MLGLGDIVGLVDVTCSLVPKTSIQEPGNEASLSQN